MADPKVVLVLVSHRHDAVPPPEGSSDGHHYGLFYLDHPLARKVDKLLGVEEMTDACEGEEGLGPAG